MSKPSPGKRWLQYQHCEAAEESVGRSAWEGRAYIVSIGHLQSAHIQHVGTHLILFASSWYNSYVSATPVVFVPKLALDQVEPATYCMKDARCRPLPDRHTRLAACKPYPLGS